MLQFPIDVLLSGFESMGLAFLVSSLLALPLLALIAKLNSKQEIYEHAPESHQAKQGTPTMGGLIILAGLVPTLAVVAIGHKESGTWKLLPAVVLAFAVIGFLDDYVVPKLTGKRGLGWKEKFTLQIGAAALVPLYLDMPFNGLSWSVVIVLTLFFVNAFNFADGLDGLAGGLAVIFCLGAIPITMLALPGAPIQHISGLVGAIVPFLLLNAPKARVFMGDVGSLSVGALLSVIATLPLRDSILSLTDEATFLVEPHVGRYVSSDASWLPVAILSLLLIVELVPVPLQVFYFKVTKGKRLFPFTPIHHAFEKKGWSESKVVWSFLIFQLVITLVAVYVAIRSIPVTQG